MKMGYGEENLSIKMRMYTDNDDYCCQWMQNLIDAGELSNGTVINQDIRNLTPGDLAGHDQIHFFAGIGGWPLALKLAGWPEDWPIWTGSCPCQPWSVAGRGRGKEDERHLWPFWFPLIRECRPPVVVGEQVESPSARSWLDAVSADLETLGYTVGAADLCAAGVDAPHLRQRLYWLAIASCIRCKGSPESDDTTGGTRGQARRDSEACHVGHTNGRGGKGNPGTICRQEDWSSMRKIIDGVGSTGATCGFWRHAEWIFCRDGKYRAVEPGSFPLAHGLPRGMGSLRPWTRELADVAGADVRGLKEAGKNRVGRIRGYGNAIVPRLAAEFLKTVMEILNEK
jgi:DNA (cytosine-5)-methyltransferase 1